MRSSYRAFALTGVLGQVPIPSVSAAASLLALACDNQACRNLGQAVRCRVCEGVNRSLSFKNRSSIIRNVPAAAVYESAVPRSK